MAQTNPRIPQMNIVTEDPQTKLVIDAIIPEAATLPDGTDFAGIFAPAAGLRILDGDAIGAYANTGTTADPEFTSTTV